MEKEAEGVVRQLPQWPMWVAVVLATLAAVLIAAMVPLISTDTLCRYAPMAEAFAESNWEEAVHPRFCVGMPVLSGLVRRLTGLDGLASCAAACNLSVAGSVDGSRSLAETLELEKKFKRRSVCW